MNTNNREIPLQPFASGAGRAGLLLRAAASLLVCVATAAHAQTPLDQSFPEKVGTYTRTSAAKAKPSATDAADAAEAKYTASSGDITWKAMAFATPEQAQAALASTLEKLQKEGAKVSGSINNAEGKVRYAALEAKDGPAYCWVNKKQKNVLYIATGKAPDLAKFMELQNTW